MKNLARGLALWLFIASLTLNAKAQRDDEAVRKLPQMFCDAWAKHDGHKLATIMAANVDFVTVGAHWFHGRADFEKYHSPLLSGRFKEASLTLRQTEVRLFMSAARSASLFFWISVNRKTRGRPYRFGQP